MISQRADVNNNLIIDKSKGAVNWITVLKQCLYHWPLFVIGLLLTFTTGLIYLSTTNPVYVVNSSILIKNEKKSSDQQTSSHDIDLLNSTRIIENELEILSSKQLLGRVVDDLNLWINYQQKDGMFGHMDLYKNSPVTLAVISRGVKLPGKLAVKIKDNSGYAIESADGQIMQYAFNKVYQSDFGSWKLAPTKTLQQFAGKTINITINDPDITTLGLQKSISASLPNKLATVVELSLTDEVPERAKEVLDNLVFNYKLEDATERDQDAKKTIDSIDKSIASLGGQVTDNEKGIESYKSSRGLTDLTAASVSSQQQRQDNAKELNTVNVQLNVINGIEGYLNSPKSSAPPSTNGINDPTIIKSIDRLFELQARKDKLSETLPETNPDVKDINLLIQNNQAAIRKNIDNYKGTLQSQKRGLQSVNNSIESVIKEIPTQEREFGNLTRNQAGKENVLSFLLQKREEFRLSFAAKIKNDRIIDPAYVSSMQNKKSMVFAIALFLGLALPAGLIIGRNKLNGHVATAADITAAIDIPLISELPFDASQSSIATDVETNAVGEQFRILRTKLHYLNGSKDAGKVILLTSSVAAEGKSYVSRNLGLAFAFAEKKTIILELDLRKPKIAKSFKLSENHPGITDYLKGLNSIEQIIQTSGSDPNLDIISSGAVVNNPSEMLEKDSVRILVDILKKDYDHIIIDSPPIKLVADAMVLSRLADTILFMVRQGFTKQDDLDAVKSFQHQNNLSNIYLVFNGIQRNKHGYGDSYNNDYYTQQKGSKFQLAMFTDFANRF
jgi:tyrosine-protein kinase Etk/Wzc